MDDRKAPTPGRPGKDEAPDFLSDFRRVKDKVGVTGLAAIGFVLAAIVAGIVFMRVPA